jgi:serine protease AprX
MGDEEPVQIMIELDASQGNDWFARRVEELSRFGFRRDGAYPVLPMRRLPDGPAEEADAAGDVTGFAVTSKIVRGTADRRQLAALGTQEGVLTAWLDTEVFPVATSVTCPIKPCECDRMRAKGDTSDAADALRAPDVWRQGWTGAGVAVAIVDGGLTAKGRIPNGSIDRVVDGWPTTDWGTVDGWKGHANMCAADCAAIAPRASFLDVRIAAAVSGQSYISNAALGMEWVIQRYLATGVPHVVSNSWSIWQRAFDAAYATDPNHFLTRKMVEAVARGIAVLFAAGNCGAGCAAYSMCGSDLGPGRSIWGAARSPVVITAGAVNIDRRLIGYSSAGGGDSALLKPDICGVSHFKGYTAIDGGTSAACGTVAGVAALLKQARPSLKPSELHRAFISTADQIGGLTGWNPYSGLGLVNARRALGYVQALP